MSDGLQGWKHRKYYRTERVWEGEYRSIPASVIGEFTRYMVIEEEPHVLVLVAMMYGKRPHQTWKVKWMHLPMSMETGARAVKVMKEGKTLPDEIASELLPEDPLGMVKWPNAPK